MKKSSTLITTLVMILIFSSMSYGEWVAQDIGLPQDMQVIDYTIIDENTVWAVGGRPFDDPSFRGLGRTTDGGLTWEYQVVSIPGLDLDDFFFVNVFALTDSIAWVLLADTNMPHRGRVLKTVDAGASWSYQSDAYPNQPGLHNGPDFIHFFNENEGITIGDLCEMYITSDGGDSWTKVPTSLYPAILDNEDPHNSGYSVAGDSTLWFATNQGRVYKTSDRGSSWAVADIGFGQTTTFVSFQDEMTGLATAPVAGTGIAKTTDGGMTWNMLPHSLPIPAVFIHVEGTENTYMYGSGDLPLYLSSAPGSGFTSDFGASFFGQGDESFRPALWYNSTTGWCGGADNMIYKWVEPSGSPYWLTQNPGYPEDMSIFSHHVVNEDIVWTIGGRRTDQPIYHGFSMTMNGGSTWDFGEISNPGLDNYFMTHVYGLDESTAWITLADNTSSPIQGRLYKTTDGGNSWVHQSSAYPNSGSQGESSNFVHFFDADNGVTVGDFRKTYVTSNGGDDWTLVNTANNPALLQGEEPGMSNYTAVGDSTIYYGTNKGRVFATHDRGYSWTVSDPGFGATHLWTSFQSEMVGVATSPFTGDGKGIAKTEDGGMTWTMLTERLPIPGILVHVKGTEQTYMYAAGALPLYIPGTSYGSGFTSNFGESWEFQNDLEFLPGNFADNTVGWTTATDNKIYKWVGPSFPAGPTGIIDRTEISPESYNLSRNYPNPFNPSTTIEYALGVSGQVSLDVFDLKGQQVLSLVSGYQDAGNYMVRMDGSYLASGTYIYQLKTASGTMSHKMLLIK